MKRLLLTIACVVMLCSVASAKGVSVEALRVCHLENPLAIDTPTPSFSWQIHSAKAGDEQTSYRIRVASSEELLARGEADVWDSGVVQSEQMVQVLYGGEPLKARHQYWWQVELTTALGRRVLRSEIGRFGVGILSAEDIAGEFIGVEGSAERAVMLRRSFKVEQMGEAALMQINSLGYHEIWINGCRVGDAVLAPALSQLNKRSQWVCYDVSPYLMEGENDVVVWLGQGWYKRGTFGRWEPDEPYTEPLVRAQIDLYVEGEPTTICATDDSWLGAKTGYRDTGSWNALDFGGEQIDARLNPVTMQREELDVLAWGKVIVREKKNHVATPQMVEADKIQYRLEPQQVTKVGENEWKVDFGKVITGWLEFKAEGLLSGECVEIEYSDEVDKEGNLLDQRQRDSYIARGKNDVFCNKFNHHAFRYLRIKGLKQAPSKDNMAALAIYTDYTTDSSFECSDEDLNAIHAMIQRTMTCLTFNGYMVDCPHLERAGYGGDGNSSTVALQTMYGVAPLYQNWVQSWADAMREGGSLPHVSPNAGAGGGGPYWCGFMVMAPYSTWLNYGDELIVERHYDKMVEWMGYVERHFKDGLKHRWPDTPYRDWYLGDWLAPMGVDAGNGESVMLVNNCFISDCYARMAQMARLLGKEADVERWERSREALNKAIHSRFYDAKRRAYATGSQLDMVYPMLVGATPAELTEDVRESLMRYSKEQMKDHIGGGLVGVPLITRWAIEAGEVDWMYRMLKQRDYPGYLYMIDNGATATWEYWNGERSRVHNCYNGVATWFYQALGGLQPLIEGAGYSRVKIEPQVAKGVEWCNISKQTPYGEITIGWQKQQGEFVMEITLPVGVEAEVVIPAEAQNIKHNKQSLQSGEQVVIKSGKHTLKYDI